MTAPLLHFVVALQCEAKPLIEHYRLKRRMDQQAFPVYEKGSVSLTVSGIGKTSAAAAVAYTQALFDNPGHSVWLNIGIAGHNSDAISEIFIAHKITDQETGHRWYPPIVINPCCSSSELTTVAKPEKEYRTKCLYDMEAAGFYPTAARFSTSELIQCLKVVSDNNPTSQAQLNPKNVSSLIKTNLEVIENIDTQLQKMAQTISVSPPRGLAEFLQHWHFTGHQQHHLEQLLRQWEIISPDQPPNLENLKPSKTGNDVLCWLKTRLDDLPVNF